MEIAEAVEVTEEPDFEMIELTEACYGDDAPIMAGSCGGHNVFHSS